MSVTSNVSSAAKLPSNEASHSKTLRIENDKNSASPTMHANTSSKVLRSSDRGSVERIEIQKSRNEDFTSKFRKQTERKNKSITAYASGLEAMYAKSKGSNIRMSDEKALDILRKSIEKHK
jgi:hypothetical protein